LWSNCLYFPPIFSQSPTYRLKSNMPYSESGKVEDSKWIPSWSALTFGWFVLSHTSLTVKNELGAMTEWWIYNSNTSPLFDRNRKLKNGYNNPLLVTSNHMLWHVRMLLTTSKYKTFYVPFSILNNMLSLKIAVFWVVAPYSLVEVYQRFRGPCCLHHQGDLWNVGKLLPDYTALSTLYSLRYW
jgi:hypothetical protein